MTWDEQQLSLPSMSRDEEQEEEEDVLHRLLLMPLFLLFPVMPVIVVELWWLLFPTDIMGSAWTPVDEGRKCMTFGGRKEEELDEEPIR